MLVSRHKKIYVFLLFLVLFVLATSAFTYLSIDFEVQSTVAVASTAPGSGTGAVPAVDKETEAIQPVENELLPLASASGITAKKSTGPLYYSTYEFQQTHNSYFPESRMKLTADWLADNFGKYGFEYFVLDGWINTATRHTPNGYVTTHADSWKHDLSYWAEYLHEKGLKFGFYYPPFWIHKTLAGDTGAFVEDTRIKVADVVSKSKMFEDWYLVDPDKPGAREYMEGFIRFLGQCGVDYLKVDFLMHYENAMGSAKLSKTLSILSSAAEKSGILISWSAPNNHKHAAVERQYGDMLRISQDVYAGGWGPFSGNDRGKANRKGWPEWDNAFDAFISYSDLSGRNGIILDGDFVIAHSFLTAAEAKAAVSLPILAGAGLGMTDIPEELGGRAWVYTNREILELNKQGLIGRPLSRRMDTPEIPNPSSQIWIGQVDGGDWIVGFFNREEKTEKRSISFKTLGINGTAKVRDLWKHADCGRMSSFAENVEPHGVTVIRISP